MPFPIQLLFRRGKRLPTILAAEASECGLACLGMVGAYHGHDLDLNGLRQRFPLSLSGISLASMSHLAAQIGLSARSLRVELHALRRLQLPAILHWDFNHFVVLKSVTVRKAVIHDPSRGRVEMSIQELSNHFTGAALELYRSETFEPLHATIPIKISSLWTKIHGLGPAVVQVLLLSIGLQLVTFAAPFQMQLVIDQALARQDSSLLLIIAVGFAALMLLQGVIEALRGWAIQLFGGQLVFQIVGGLVHHLLRVSPEYFEKRHVGDVMSRLGSARAIRDALSTGIIAAILDGAMALIAGIILFLYSPMLALVVLTSLALVIASTLGFYPILRDRSMESIRVTANEQTLLMEMIRAISTIKVMGREPEREAVWRNAYVKTFNASISLGRFQLSLNLIQTTMIGLQTVLVIYLGALRILHGAAFSLGMLIAFLSFRQTFSDRALSLVSQALQFKLLGLHLQRLGDIIAQPLETAEVATQVDVNGRISLSGVSFRYGATGPWLFRNLDFEIRAGEFLAMTGPSGCGKTSLLKLLVGIHQPQEGCIILDGLVARPDIWRGWRSQVGMVSQDDRLLSGSLADNIAFFDPAVDMGRVVAAAKAAQVHTSIMEMSMQYHTLVGDMGSTLSGGQYQRILLARAIYREPKVLILDEGTANLDEETESAIAGVVMQMPITRIVVAHRPALVICADRVLKLSHGELEDVTSIWHERRAQHLQLVPA